MYTKIGFQPGHYLETGGRGGITPFANHLYSLSHIFPLGSLEQKSKKDLGFVIVLGYLVISQNFSSIHINAVYNQYLSFDIK